jgi:hypothetical protein
MIFAMTMTGPERTEQTRWTWARAASVAALLYPIVGITFAAPLQASSPRAVILLWRFAAWLVSAVIFATHLGYEHSRLRSSLLRGALHSSAAVALGAFLLAVWINVHGLWSASAHQSPLALLALVLFPLVTGPPAFVVGLAILTVMNRLKVRSGA